MNNGTLEFSKDGKFLDGKVAAGIRLDVRNAPAVAAALAANRPFPPGMVALGTVSARTKGGSRPIHFRGSRGGVVSFRGKAGLGGELGVYSSPDELRADLDPEGRILDGLDLPVTGISRYAVLNWDYDIQAAAKGSVALGAGSGIKFSADGQQEGLFAVIRAFAEDPPARDAIQSAIDNWMLPGHVALPEDLAPGTWLVAEVDGEFAARLGACIGYDYSWIRRTSLGMLSGDIGLRIQAAADATIGLSASGKYILVVARESLDPASRMVRAKLSKTARRGWEFALNASVGLSGRTRGLIPEDLDDFILGVFGLHGVQLVKDLQMFRGWTDVAVPLPELFAGFVASYVRGRLSTLAGDEATRLGMARARIADFLNRWNELPRQVCSLLWSELRKRGGKADADFGASLVPLAGSTEAETRHMMELYSGSPAFFDSAAGRWLEAVVDEDLMAALVDDDKAGTVGKAAASTLAILEGGILEELVRYAARELNLDRVQNAGGAAPLENHDPWLKEKLSRFLGEELCLERLDHIRKALAFLTGHVREIYDSAVSALNDTHSASFEAAYSRASTNTALIDVSFDFSHSPGLSDALSAVIDGDWRTVLFSGSAGITLRNAVLTHGIRRHGSVEINLPYFSGSVSRLTNALSRMTVAEEGGRIFIYEIGARDEIKVQHRWRSSLAISGKIVAGTGGSLRVFATQEQLDDAMSYGYSFRMAFPSMRALHLRQHLQPLVSCYFPRWCGEAGSRTALEAWVADLEGRARLANGRSPGCLGNTLLSLRVSLPGKVVAAWGECPGNERDARYMDMSRALQGALRRIIPACYFQDPRRFAAAETPIAAQVLVYQALPVSTSISTDGRELELDTDEASYWDYRDANERRAMIFNDVTGAALLLRMQQVRDLLLETDGLTQYAEDFAPRNLDRLREAAFDPSGEDLLTRSLLFAEAQAIGHACAAGCGMASFRRSAGTDPSEALESMAGFGEKIAATFNSSLSDLFRGQGPNVRELGSLLLLEAARALEPGLKAEPTARLEVTVLREPMPMSWADDFLGGKRPTSDAIAVRQSLVEVPSSRIF